MNRQTIARIADAYGGLPRLFAVSVDTDHPTGAVAAWGVEFPDGSAITCKPAAARSAPGSRRSTPPPSSATAPAPFTSAVPMPETTAQD